MSSPVVASSTPSTGSTTFDGKRNSLVATFNVALLSSTVTRSTVYLYESATGSTVDVDVSLSSDGLTVTVIPRKPLREVTNYVWSFVGSDLGSPGGYIKCSDGDAMTSTHTVTFRTDTERFVSLEEITSRSDIERVGPIRSTEDEAATAGVLEIASVTPSGFASNITRTLSEIVVDFGEAVSTTGSLDSLTLTVAPADGMIRDYGFEDATGKYLYRDVEQVASRLALINTTPVGTVAASGDTIVWTRDSSYTFPYNAEVTVRVHSDRIVNSSAYQLEDDVYFMFTTTYWPVYATPTVIRIELGPTISSLYDDTIYRIILKNSVRAILESNDNVGASSSRDYVYGNTEKFVKSQTIIDVIDQLRLLADVQAGQRKSLGDFTVQYNATNPLLIAKRAEAVNDRDRALRELRRARGLGGPRSAIRASEHEYERSDFRMRSWDSVVASSLPIANTAADRRAKRDLRTDHPTTSEAGRRLIIDQDDEIIVSGDGVGVITL